jgi:hypothetical protein
MSAVLCAPYKAGKKRGKKARSGWVLLGKEAHWLHLHRPMLAQLAGAGSFELDVQVTVNLSCT